MSRGSTAGTGVSTEVGRALLVATAVVTAAVIGALVFGNAGGTGEVEPEASFSVTQDGPSSIEIVHDRGEAIDGENLYVISASGDRLGNYAGTDGQACDRRIPQVTSGTECRVSGLSDPRVSVVWRSGNRSDIVYDDVAPDDRS